MSKTTTILLIMLVVVLIAVLGVWAYYATRPKESPFGELLKDVTPFIPLFA